MRELRVVFMGTPEFAVGVLERMLDDGVNVVAVITSTDKPAGRGRMLRHSAVKQFAAKRKLPVLQPPNLKDSAFHEELASYQANLFVVVAFRMLPKMVWSMPQYGTFNLHASLLPWYRGAAPINWAIINREKKTGVTTFFIDQHIDSGELILQKEVPIEANETAGTLHDKLMVAGADLVVRTIKLIEQSAVEPKAQPDLTGLRTAPKLSTENTRINWKGTYNEIDAFVRGLCPYPAAWTVLHNEGSEIRAKIYELEFEPKGKPSEPGTVSISDGKIKVSVEDGVAIIHKLQLSGKRKMSAKELLNGFKFSKGAKFS